MTAGPQLQFGLSIFQHSSCYFHVAKNENKTIAKGERNKTFPENPLRLEAGRGLGSGTAAALVVKAVCSGRSKQTRGQHWEAGRRPPAQEAWRGGGKPGPRLLRAVLLYLETLTLVVFLMYKAKQLIKRHLETAETHSFHVTYFKKR